MNKQLSGGMNELNTEHNITYKYDETAGKRKAEPIVFTKKDYFFALSMLVIGFLYWNLIMAAGPGAGVTIFAAIFCTSAGLYLKLNGIHQTKESIICLVVVILSAANFPLFDNNFVKALNFIFLSVSSVYWICLLTNRRIEGRIAVSFIGDMFNQLAVVPFSNLNCCLSGIFKGIGKGKRSRGFLGALIGLVISLPVLFVVTSLLIDADAAFEQLIGNIRFTVSERLFEYIIQIIFGIPVASYLFGLIYGDLKKRHTDHITMNTVSTKKKSLQFAPGVTVYSALTALNAIYLLFFLSQTAYLFSAFENRLPEAMTYAEYARRGFFELCMVAGINLFVIVIAHLITSRSKRQDENASDNTKPINDIPKPLKTETVLICIFTIMLIVTAISKMAMYIEFYGLTQLRVYATWFMVLLLFTFVIVGARQFKDFNGFKIVLIFFVIFFMSLCYGNIDGFIAKYNIDRYSQGTLETIDVDALSGLSDAAVPYMYDLYQKTGDEGLKNSLKSEIIDDYEWGAAQGPENETFREFNLQKYNADKIREAIMQ